MISPACDSMMFRQMANPNPVPRLSRRKERFKDMKQVIGGNPAALVRHPRADAGLVPSREFRRQNADSSLLLRGFDRILNHIQEDLFDLIAVGLEGRKTRRQPTGDHEMFFLNIVSSNLSPSCTTSERLNQTGARERGLA